jgi:signal transduction histidine kinase
MQRHLVPWERTLLVERGPLLRYGFAAGLGAASVLGARLLHWLEAPEVASLALVTVVLSGIYGGLGPALLDTLITSLGLELMVPAFEPFGYGSSAVRILVHGAVGFLIADITASLRWAHRNLRRENEARELATRARENVLGIVSHDLRSPLSVIKMTVAALKHGARGGRRAADDVALLLSLERSAAQMHRLVDDLLDAVRIEKGQFRIERSRNELVPLVEDALQSVRALAEARGIRLRPRLQEAPVWVECDGVRIVQVLSNLLHNAVKFSPDGGFIDVETAVEPGSVCISVRDHGPGIQEDAHESLFQRYWQGARGAHQGTGLGLFIAKSIVDAHGGTIGVESSPGRGACFRVRLPA